MIGLVGAAAALLSAVLTGLVRLFALRQGMVDVPGSRTSHTGAVPRGGGAGFVLVTLIALPFLAARFPDSANLWVAIAGGTAIALIGWIDDRRSLPAWSRFIVHGLAAAWAVYWLEGLPVLQLGGATLPLGPFGLLISWLMIVWFVNLFNFMDGIHGIAAGEAILVAGFGAVLAWLTNDAPLAIYLVLFAAAVAGFLPWNFPAARVFMGDLGSGYIGFVLAVVALRSENAGGAPLLLWLVLLSVFLVDATATLIARMARGDRWYEPHREHVYQRAVHAGHRHATVTALVLSVTALLGASSIMVLAAPPLVLVLAVLTYGLLFELWRRLRTHLVPTKKCTVPTVSSRS